MASQHSSAKSDFLTLESFQISQLYLNLSSLDKLLERRKLLVALSKRHGLASGTDYTTIHTKLLHLIIFNLIKLPLHACTLLNEFESSNGWIGF